MMENEESRDRIKKHIAEWRNLQYRIRNWLAENGFELLPDEIGIATGELIDEGNPKPTLNQVLERLIGKEGVEKLMQ